MTRLALIGLLVACGGSQPSAPRTTSGGADDGFCADERQHCGPSSHAVSCCDALVCTPISDGSDEVLVHQCLAP